MEYLWYCLPMDLAEYLSKAGMTQAELAARLGVSPGAVSHWVTGRKRVTAELCPEIERLTGGKVRCEDLRSDIGWAVLRDSSCAT